MKYFLLCGLFLFTAALAYPQKMDANQIRQKMAEIRRSTNWDNAAEAKKANEQIRELSKQLMMSGKKNSNSNNEQAKEQLEKGVEFRSKLFKQMWETAKKGEHADILLAEPVRKEIIEEFKNDESPKVESSGYYDDMTMLCIDMSLKTVQRTIDQMDKYKSIKTLVITGGQFGMPVNLDDLLYRARNYPLEQLYIINFKNFVTEVPKRTGSFKKLILLSLVNNNIKKLPADIGNLNLLKTLYVDINPITTALPAAGKLIHLENLGIAKTNIPKEEVERIKQLLPNCKITTQ